MFLKGKTALITGSTSGIGLAYAKALAAEGASVVINGFGDAAAIEATRASLAELSGAPAFYKPTDMSDPEAIAAMVAEVHEETGGPDILIANAGMQHVEAIDTFPTAKWDKIIAINLSSAFHLMQAAIPLMKQKKWGRIISTASAHSMIASAYKSAYVSAKHGLIGLTKTAALETATFGITVNAISPGYVWTPLVEEQIPDTMKARGLTREQVIKDVLLANQPTAEFATAEQIAALALFLCRDEAAQITGANYPVDGAYTAR